MARNALEARVDTSRAVKENTVGRTTRIWIAVCVLAAVVVAAIAYPTIRAGAEHRRVLKEAASVQAQAEKLMAQGKTMAAYDLIHAALGRGIDTPALRAYYKTVSAEFIVESARKAHVQHGAEGTGGVLAPEDVKH